MADVVEDVLIDAAVVVASATENIDVAFSDENECVDNNELFGNVIPVGFESEVVEKIIY